MRVSLHKPATIINSLASISFSCVTVSDAYILYWYHYYRTYIHTYLHHVFHVLSQLFCRYIGLCWDYNEELSYVLWDNNSIAVSAQTTISTETRHSKSMTNGIYEAIIYTCFCTGKWNWSWITLSRLISSCIRNVIKSRMLYAKCSLQWRHFVSRYQLMHRSIAFVIQHF